MIGDEVRYGNDLFRIVGAKLTAIAQPLGTDERVRVLLDPASLDRVRPRGRLRACWRAVRLFFIRWDRDHDKEWLDAQW